MTTTSNTYGKSIAAYYGKNKAPIPLKEDCPGCAILLRGRKNSDARVSSELNAALRFAPQATKRVMV